jgi:hypothetical protein
MDLLVERIRSRDPSSIMHCPVPRKVVLGATFAKSMKPVSLFQGYHHRAKHVGSGFRPFHRRGRGTTTKHMMKRGSELEANEPSDNLNYTFRKLNDQMAHEALKGIVRSEICLFVLDLM